MTAPGGLALAATDAAALAVGSLVLVNTLVDFVEGHVCGQLSVVRCTPLCECDAAEALDVFGGAELFQRGQRRLNDGDLVTRVEALGDHILDSGRFAHGADRGARDD